MDVKFEKKDVIVMKLLHYFITEKNYNPIILYGVQNEIWLENMDSDYKIVRIVFDYIHNNEQFGYDLFKAKKIAKNIKRKTFNLHMDILSIFTDLGDSVSLSSVPHIDCAFVKNEQDLSKYDFIYKTFPDIDKKLKFDEKGVDLFIKITNDINEKNQKEATKAEKVFTPKKPIITYGLIIINVLIFLYGILFNQSSYLINKFAIYGPFIRQGDYYRLLTGAFIHIDILHIFFNMYSLYIIGSQIESFFGKFKYLIIYIFSVITASLLSILLNINVPSIGASGAIFGLLGAMLYFGYHYRVFLGNTMTKQIIPIILFNLLIGFMYNGIDNFAHIGGLIGGIFITMTLGVPNKDNKASKINGIILTVILLLFLVFMNFFYVK